MKYLKNIIKTTIISLLIFAASASSASSSVSGFSSCDNVIALAVTNSSFNVEDITLNQELKKCMKEKSLFSLPTKVLYLIFGDIVLDISGKIFAESSLSQSAHDYYDEMRINDSNSGMKSVFNAITVLIFIIATAVMSYQGFLMLYNGAKDGSFMGKDANATWTLIKIAMGITLLMPMPEFNGYSLAQTMVITAAILTSVITGILWMIIIILMNFLFTVNYNEVNNDLIAKLTPSSINVVNNAVSIEICNIERDIIGLDKDAVKGKITQITHNKHKYQECLNERTAESLVADTINSISIMPKRNMDTEYCLKDVYEIESDTSCGSYKNTVIDESENIEVMEIFSKKARSIASKIINSQCINADIFEKYGKPYQYGYICGELDDNAKYSFSGPNGTLSYMDKDTDYANYREIIESEIGDFINYTNEVGAAIKGNRTSDLLLENKKKIKQKFNSGWFSSSHYLMDVSNEYREIEIASIKTWDGTYALYSGGNTDIIYKIGVSTNDDRNPITGQYKELSKKHGLIIQSKDLEEEISSLGKFSDFFGESKSFTDKLFSGFYSLNTFLGIKDSSIANELSKESNCFVDFNKCSIASVNPLFEYVKMGGDMFTMSANVLLSLKVVDFVIDKIAGTNSDGDIKQGFWAGIGFVTGLISALIVVYFTISIMIVYLTPLIPFLYVLSFIISWVILVIEGVITAQLWAFMHLTISKEEGLSKNVKSGYNLLFTIFIKPPIIVLSVIICLVASSAAIGIFNVLFGIILSLLPASDSPTSIVSFSLNVFAYLIYALLLTVTLLRITKIIFELPNKTSELLKLTQMSGGQGTEFNEVISKFGMMNSKIFNMFGR